MSARHLLISNPPHGDVDALEAASQFGLTAAEVGMKANYAVPEIWFAEEDEAKLQEIASALEAAGLNTTIVAGSDLLIPVQNPAESFEFTEWGLQLDLGDSEWTLAYDAPAIAVYGRPRVDTPEGRAPTRSVASQVGSWGRGRARGGSSPDAGLVELEASPFLDIFAPSDGGLRRASIVQEITSFSELPGDSPHGLSAMQNLAAEFENRFENVHVDRRLVDMTLRGISRVVIGAMPGEPARTGFSYATEALAQLLASLSPDLKDLHQADLSSRLVYLTNQSRIS